MTYQKLLQQVIGAILVITVIGCIAPSTPLESPTPMQPMRVPTVIINPTPTLFQISSFEECVELGNSIQSTYPRQCISDSGEIFKEVLPEGVIFSKIYGEKGHYEDAFFITSTINGGYLITGAANGYQCLIRKLDASGETEWEYALGLELREEFQFPNGMFSCWSARQTSDGSYVIIGTGRTEFGLIGKFFIIKLDRDGKWGSAEIIVEREGKIAHLDKEGSVIWLNSFDMGGEVIETSDGGYAIAGRFSSGSPDSSTHIIKTNANGAFVWEKNLCLDKNVQQAWEKETVCSYNNLWDAIQSQDGGYVMTGGFGNGAWLVKTDSNGNVEWIQSYMQESWNAGHALIQLPDGGYLIAGAQLIDQKYQDGTLIKTDSAGNLQWSRTFGGDKHDRFLLMEQGSNNEIIVIGSTESFGEGASHIWLLGFDITNLK